MCLNTYSFPSIHKEGTKSIRRVLKPSFNIFPFLSIQQSEFFALNRLNGRWSIALQYSTKSDQQFFIPFICVVPSDFLACNSQIKSRNSNPNERAVSIINLLFQDPFNAKLHSTRTILFSFTISKCVIYLFRRLILSDGINVSHVDKKTNAIPMVCCCCVCPIRLQKHPNE